jgi:Tol biopolymer transport system component
MGGWTWDDWDVYVVNPDGSGLRRVTTEKHYQLRWPRFTADGKRIYYSTIGGRQPYVSRVVDLTGKPQAGPLERSNSPNGGTGAWASDARQSFDGQSFVFISDRLRPFSYDVMLGDSKGINVTSLGIAQRGSTYNNNPVLSPDNKRILFLASDAEKIASQDIRSLWEVRSDGSSPRQIADAQLFTNPRTWKGRTKGKP